MTAIRNGARASARRKSFLLRSVMTLSAFIVAGVGVKTFSKISFAASCRAPSILQFQVVSTLKRSASAFTEGLIYLDGELFESVGGYGDSRFQKISPGNGTIEVLSTLPATDFGEGLESLNGIFYQLTWKEHRGYAWDEDGRLLGQFAYPYEGWGLAHDSRSDTGAWVASDGTNTLHFFDHAPPLSTSTSANIAWSENSRVSVMNGAQPETNLNELEYAGDVIFANVYQSNRIVRIDPASGCVTGEADMGALVDRAGIHLDQNPSFVLNGIAYRQEKGTFFITGKNWPAIYEVRFLPSGAT